MSDFHPSIYSEIKKERKEEKRQPKKQLAEIESKDIAIRNKLLAKKQAGENIRLRSCCDRALYTWQQHWSNIERSHSIKSGRLLSHLLPMFTLYLHYIRTWSFGITVWELSHQPTFKEICYRRLKCMNKVEKRSYDTHFDTIPK